MKALTVNPTDEIVLQYLATIFVEYSASYGGETKREDWECDQWNIKFQGPERRVIESQFHTGLGLRQEAKMPDWEKKMVGRFGIQAWHRKNDKPQSPSAASVLSNLMMAGQALDTSFSYWCSDLGYDEDSIKALNLYQACCEIGKKLNQMFNHHQREMLTKLLEDY